MARLVSIGPFPLRTTNAWRLRLLDIPVRVRAAWSTGLELLKLAKHVSPIHIEYLKNINIGGANRKSSHF